MPINETEKDRAKEGAVAQWLHEKTKQEYLRYEKLSPVDYLTYSNKYERYMLVEIKCRDIKPDYPDIWLPCSKVAAVIPWMQMGYGFAFVVATTEVVYIYTCLVNSNMNEFKRGLVKRNNRGEGFGDKPELAIHIPMDKFIKIRRT